MSIVSKEVAVLRLKLIKVIYLKLESSFLGPVDGRTTKDMLTLLKALGEENIEATLFSSRSRFMRDHVQRAVVKNGGGVKIIGTIEQFLSHLDNNMKEFSTLKIDGADEWVLDRLTEARGLVNVYLQSADKLEDIKAIDSIVERFNYER